ncbi:uncharacterized protein SPPG_07618 [Spizellomyces punctatus DAOM BR117]|uniref:Uncharacterized protein n=1 Tax=Spizellomyces punctatus (strain DAOM BR117) TaxID=645134 RepID=A0A0L0H8E6_SPIPD|nr:uncharacterized protein SPPG_07618 [Spizellomyces punctatus DAOM BR117]KNC97231.1 hypothetical protein SPPG_07618 [Spizellomyces punctatus DAOM BR117]|eukprot:XP_016605271.1 hypothetical protein SPPG_07618 [Spizellomyces punctatus DAOM BR117]
MNFHLFYEEDGCENGFVCRSDGNILVATNDNEITITLGEEKPPNLGPSSSIHDLVAEKLCDQPTKRTAKEIEEDLDARRRELTIAREQRDFGNAKFLHFEKIPQLQEELLQVLGTNRTEDRREPSAPVLSAEEDFIALPSDDEEVNFSCAKKAKRYWAVPAKKARVEKMSVDNEDLRIQLSSAGTSSQHALEAVQQRKPRKGTRDRYHCKVDLYINGKLWKRDCVFVIVTKQGSERSTVSVQYDLSEELPLQTTRPRYIIYHDRTYISFDDTRPPHAITFSSATGFFDWYHNEDFRGFAFQYAGNINEILIADVEGKDSLAIMYEALHRL